MAEKKLITEHFEKTDLTNISEYEAFGGYTALKKALKTSSEAIIEQISDSGLRGRGGAGFPTGSKWKFTSAYKYEEKYVICNADEGEPGTFKDRIIMEKNPHLYIEGIIIAAKAIGASKGYVYIRGEYYNAIENTKIAIQDAYKNGYLGENILDSGFSFNLKIKLGAGSYLCGEELTLIESLEGKRGNPRIKPPFPAEIGLFNKPTLVNNVETLANIPLIINMGSVAYKNIGVKNARGTKLFTVSGDVQNPGMFEMELGSTLSEIIKLAGGTKSGNKPKAILLGGAAGTFVSSEHISVPMDYDSLAGIRATMGSGAIIILDQNRSIYDMLVSIIHFFKHESCGKCVPCRVGCKHLVNYLEELKSAQNKKSVLNIIVRQTEHMAQNSLCPLGQSPIMPVKSAVRFFEEELLS
ncbi:MAG: NADH-quinone oxidoreductase subunit NuoF [Bacteroidales bacterium]|nr:NADH-quinone oxidoreductase subunit NuoF [Bacteroidales bacterium]